MTTPTPKPAPLARVQPRGDERLFVARTPDHHGPHAHADWSWRCPLCDATDAKVWTDRELLVCYAHHKRVEEGGHTLATREQRPAWMTATGHGESGGIAAWERDEIERHRRDEQARRERVAALNRIVGDPKKILPRLLQEEPMDAEGLSPLPAVGNLAYRALVAGIVLACWNVARTLEGRHDAVIDLGLARRTVNAVVRGLAREPPTGVPLLDAEGLPQIVDVPADEHGIRWTAPFSGAKHAIGAAFELGALALGGDGAIAWNGEEGATPLPQGLQFGQMHCKPTRGCAGSAKNEDRVLEAVAAAQAVAKAQLTPAQLEVLRLAVHGIQRGKARRLGDGTVLPAVEPLKPRDMFGRSAVPGDVEHEAALLRLRRTPGAPRTEHEAALMLRQGLRAVEVQLVEAALMAPRLKRAPSKGRSRVGESVDVEGGGA